jgi:transposase/CelD/BcsL family acetyltransferase involved in cellulose biosynthesis
VHSRRAIVNAILYAGRAGCPWRYLPKDFPPWQTVYGYFAAWRDDGTLQRIHDQLREQARAAAGRNITPASPGRSACYSLEVANQKSSGWRTGERENVSTSRGEDCWREMRPLADGDHAARDPVVAPPTLLDVPHLNGWAAQWDQLVDSSPLPSPFLRSWWLTGASGPGRHFLLVVDGAHLLGGLAVEKRHTMLSIRMMGDGALCPDHLDLLAAPGDETAVVDLLRDWLCRPGERLLDLRGIRAGSRLVEALPGHVRREPMAIVPFAPLPNSPEAYRATLPAQFRKNLRVSAKRLAAEGLANQTFRGRAVVQRLDTLRELHQSQWGSRSSFLPVIDRFAAGFAGGCAADEVVVHELRKDDLVVATVTAFEVAGRVSLYQSARLTDRRWRDATTVLLGAIIDDACVRGFKEVDFLRGDEPYKGRFTRNHREILRLVAGKGVVGRLGGAAHAATSQAMKTAVRGVRFGRSTVARWRPN